MRTPLVLAFAGAIALAGGAAFAQSTVAPTGSDVSAPSAPAASTQVDMSPAGGFASSSTLGDTSKLKAGDANVVSNAPVPDTRDNRAKFGRPMSNAGRKTAASGD